MSPENESLTPYLEKISPENNSSTPEQNFNLSTKANTSRDTGYNGEFSTYPGEEDDKTKIPKPNKKKR